MGVRTRCGNKEFVLVDTNDVRVNDSGWITPTLTSDFTFYADNSNALKYRKIGKMVEIRGAVKPTKTITGDSTQHLIFTLPEGFRPSFYSVDILCQGSNYNSWLCEIKTDGNVYFSRYRDLANYYNVSSAHWLPIHATFFVD